MVLHGKNATVSYYPLPYKHWTISKNPQNICSLMKYSSIKLLLIVLYVTPISINICLPLVEY